MKKYERSRLPLYISALLVFIGIIGHTVGAIIHALNMKKYYRDYSLSFKIANFIIDWLERWVWECLKNPLWCLPTAAVLFQIVWLINYAVKRRTERKYPMPAERSEKQKKASLVLLVISFLPITLIVLYSLTCMLTGYETGFFGSSATYYGGQAFCEAFLWSCLGFTVIPILPLMLVYQIVYIVRKIRK